MYLVRDKNTKEVLHVNPAPLRQNLSAKEVFFRFDPDTMEIGRKDGRLPEHYDIDHAGMILELSLAEQVNRGIVKLAENEAVVNNRIKEIPLGMKVRESVEGNDEIIPLSLAEEIEEGLTTVNEPFEYFNAEKNSIEKRDLLEIVENGLVADKHVADQLAQLISIKVAAEIAVSYPHRREMKLVKAYMDWIVDGQPEKDERQQDYLTMQKKIEEIRKRYMPAKNKCQEMLKNSKKRG